MPEFSGTDNYRLSTEPSIRLYTFPLDLTPVLSDRLVRLLNSDEIEMARRFVRPELCSRYIAAHGTLRLLLSAVSGRPADRLRMTKGPQGKPELVVTDEHPGISFNLSRSDHLGALVISSGLLPGVDIECWSAVPEATSLLQSILTDEEARLSTQLELTKESVSSELFLRNWVIKESVLKASGYGLSVDPGAVCFEPEDLAAYWQGKNIDLRARVSEDPDGAAISENYVVHPFGFTGGAGAIAHRASEATCQISPERTDLSENDIRSLAAQVGECPAKQSIPRAT